MITLFSCAVSFLVKLIAILNSELDNSSLKQLDTICDTRSDMLLQAECLSAQTETHHNHSGVQQRNEYLDASWSDIFIRSHEIGLERF